MALRQQLSPRMMQKLVITPSLQQAIKMLQLNKLELENMMRNELIENPVLEEEIDTRQNPETGMENPGDYNLSAISSSSQAQEVLTARENDHDPFDNIDVEAFFQDYIDYTYNIKPEFEHVSNDLPSYENILTKPTSLSEHLNWQLELSTDNQLLNKIGKAIIGNLNKEGYLQATIDEIVAMDSEFTEEKVKESLELIQSFDPFGIAASDLKECLLLQLKYLDIETEKCEQITKYHLDDLVANDYEKIIKTLDISQEELKSYLDIIKHLDPKPGLRYSDERTIYIEPEVYVEKENNEYKIVLNDDGLPKLRINPAYANPGVFKDGKNTDVTEFLKDKMRKALWLLKSFEQRSKTIYKVAESIVQRQKDFFDHGIDHIKPMVLSDVANDIGMHESTVSRVVNNKYMHTPLGVFEMKYFFQGGISSDSGDDISCIVVKKKIEQLVQKEDAKTPLSDARIAQLLAREGLKIARRTVAKYREELNIPSSNKRRKKNIKI